MFQADTAIVPQYDVNYFLKFHPYFINMHFHEVFVNHSNFEHLKIEERTPVKLQMCVNRNVFFKHEFTQVCYHTRFTGPAD